jgi:hypothetical protein
MISAPLFLQTIIGRNSAGALLLIGTRPSKSPSGGRSFPGAILANFTFKSAVLRDDFFVPLIVLFVSVLFIPLGENLRPFEKIFPGTFFLLPG